MHVVVGVASALLGALLSWAAIALIVVALSGPSPVRVGGYVVIAVIAALAALLFVCGLRLLARDEGKQQKLFGPWVWFTICGCFVGLATLFGYMTLALGFTASGAQAITASLLFALLSSGVGSRSRRLSPRKPPSAA
jgi:hypothetical protein